MPEHKYTVMNCRRAILYCAALATRRSRVLGTASGASVAICRSVRSRRTGTWRRWCYEHIIRNAAEFNADMDYLHFNPVKQGHATYVPDWPLSKFHWLVEMGAYSPGWAGRRAAEAVCSLNRHPAQCHLGITPQADFTLSPQRAARHPVTACPDRRRSHAPPTLKRLRRRAIRRPVRRARCAVQPLP